LIRANQCDLLQEGMFARFGFKGRALAYNQRAVKFYSPLGQAKTGPTKPNDLAVNSWFFAGFFFFSDDLVWAVPVCWAGMDTDRLVDR